MGKKGRVVNWTKRMRVHNVTERIVKGLLWDNGKGGFTHNSLSMHVNITTLSQHYQPHCFPQLAVLHTQHYQPYCCPQLAVLRTQQTQVIVCKMAQDVGLCESIACGVIPMLFEGDVLVFVQKTFLCL